MLLGATVPAQFPAEALPDRLPMDAHYQEPAVSDASGGVLPDATAYAHLEDLSALPFPAAAAGKSAAPELAVPELVFLVRRVRPVRSFQARAGVAVVELAPDKRDAVQSAA